MNMFRIFRTDRTTDASSLAGESLLLGRASTCDLQLPHPAVAPVHAGIKYHEGTFWLSAQMEPVTSPDALPVLLPVLLNTAAVRHAPLSTGDAVRIGPYLLRVAVNEQTLQITVDFALDLTLPEAEAVAPPISAGTPAEERMLERYWERRLQAAETTLTHYQSRTAAPPSEPPGGRFRRLTQRWLAVFVALLLLGVAAAAWAFPSVYSPGPLAAAHAAKTLPAASLNANRASDSCSACHTLTGTMLQQCSACHTTPTFQPAIAQKHQNLGLTCRTCHAEHRGAEFKPDLVDNAACTECHHLNLNTDASRSGPTLHGRAVSYPVKNGLWLWEGISQTVWQQQGLPGRTVDYNLREQFHMLHAQGQLQGRTQCVDCHLGGTQVAALKQHAQQSCAQCHNLQPAFAASQARLAETSSWPPGSVRCSSCHTQHGAEKDLRASVRK
jgi:hypothetical protein